MEHEGVVYGAGFEGHFRVVHKRASTKLERDGFRGSKYVQSDMKDIFRQVKDDLKHGRTVLFSGTPCQTSGLNSYVGKKLRDNLVLIDIVCHGVPGPFVWRDYLAYLEKKHGSIITYVNFRDKEIYGWKAHKETFKFENGGDKINFSYLFYQHIMFRHSCGVCHFCNTHRPSDITLADFWHFENINPNFNSDNKGANLVLVNTEKGRDIFEAIKDKINFIPAELDKCMQGNLQHPSKPHPKRIEFERYYLKYGFEKTMKHFGIIGYQHTIDVYVKKILKRIKRMIHKN